MSAPVTQNTTTLLLCASPHEVSVSLVRSFQNDGLRVVILSDETKDWGHYLSHEDIQNVSVVSFSSIDSSQRIDYVLYLDFYYGIASPSQVYANRKHSINGLRPFLISGTKSLFVLPYIQEHSLHVQTNELLSDLLHAKTLFIGEPILPVHELSKHEVWNEIINSFVSKTMQAPLAACRLHPIDTDKLVRHILRSLFSFSKKKEAYIGSSIVVNNLVRTLTKGKVDISITSSSLVLGNDEHTYISHGSYKHENLLSALRPFVKVHVKDTAQTVTKQVVVKTAKKQEHSLHTVKASGSILTPLSVQKKKTIDALVGKKPHKIKRARKQISIPKIDVSSFSKTVSKVSQSQKVSPARRKPRWRPAHTKLTLSSLGVLLLPFAIAVGAFFMTFMGEYVYSRASYNSFPIYKISGSIARFGQDVTSLYTYIPGVGEYYKKIWYSMDVLDDYIEVSRESARIKTLSRALFESLTTEQSEPTDMVLSDLLTSLDSLHSRMGYLLAEIESEERSIPHFISNVFINEHISNEKRNTILHTKQFVSELYEGLGSNEPKIYALVLYDDTKLQPVGGVVTSTILVTISGGKLIDVSTYTADFINSQIGGEIVPPTPLKNTFGVTSWPYEYAGWDISTEKSAEQISWFIDKSLETPVDGVITISPFLISSQIDDLGQLSLSTAGQTIKSASFSTVYQGVLNGESDYHGLFVQDVWDGILKGAVAARDETKMKLGESLQNSLDLKQTILYFDKPSMQRSIEELGLSGEIAPPTCGTNCISDYFGIYESVSNGSDTIKRNASLETSIEQGLIKRDLTYLLTNTTSDTIENYIRFVAPSDVGFSSVVVSTNNKAQTLVPDRFAGDDYKAVGVPVSLPPGDTVTLSIGWESGSSLVLTKRGDYVFRWFKQPGSVSYPLSITSSFPKTLQISALPDGSLTEGGVVRYNTVLERDRDIHVFW